MKKFGKNPPKGQNNYTLIIGVYINFIPISIKVKKKVSKKKEIILTCP